MSEEFKRFIAKIRENPRLHSFDEAATKQAIVIRILNLLGWNQYNVNEVFPEYTVRGKRVDYSLRFRDDDLVFIEVKKVNTDLEKHQEQLLNYSFQEGVRLAILTNGLTWWFYLPLNQGNWEQRKFYSIQLNDQEPSQIANRFNELLSKENVISGKSHENAQTIFQNKKKHSIIERNLPKAWEKIVNESDERLVELIAETTEKLSGYRPENELVSHFITKNLKKIVSAQQLQRSTKPLKKRSKVNYRVGSRTLDQILNIVELVWFENVPYNNAITIIAQQKGINKSTVIDKCTRRIGLNTAQFRELLEKPSELMSFLTTHFPYDENLIHSRLGSKSHR